MAIPDSDIEHRLDIVRQLLQGFQSEAAKKQMEELLVTSEKIIDARVKAKYYNVMGEYYYYIKDFSQAFQQFNEAYKILEEQRNRKELANTAMNMGWIKLHQGNYPMALEFFDEVLKLEESEEGVSAAWAINGMGVISLWRGLLDMASSQLDRALEIFEKFDNYDGIAATLTSYATVEIYKGQSAKALSYLSRVIEFSTKTIGMLRKGSALFYIMMIYLELQDFDGVKKIIDELELYKQNTDDKMVLQGIKVANAAYLMRSKRLENTVKAQEILEEVCNGPQYFQALSLIAMKYLIELYLIEYKGTEDENVLKSIQELTLKMENIATAQNSHYLAIELLLFRSKLAIISGDIPHALEFIEQGITQARKENFSKLEQALLHQREELVNRLKLVKDIGSSLENRFEESEIMEYIEGIKNFLPTI